MNSRGTHKRAEYESARSSNIGNEFHGFLHLPAEIRDMIYRQLLVRGNMYVPNTGEADGVLMRGVLDHNYSDHYGKRKARYEDFPTQIGSWGTWRSFQTPAVTNHGDPVAAGLLMGVNQQIQREAGKVGCTGSKAGSAY